MAISLLPKDVSFLDAVKIAGAAGKLNAVTTAFDWDDRYTLWSGLIGGMFLALAYFGTDQSQVQRYLTGKSIGQSRLGLLLNAMAKVPIQFFILFIGAMVFVVSVFDRPPLVYHPVAMELVRTLPEYPALEASFDQGFEARQGAARKIKDAPDPAARSAAIQDFNTAQKQMDQAHASAPRRGEGDRHQLHVPPLRHALSSGRRGGLDHRGDLHCGHVGDFGRNQFACDGDRDRYLQTSLESQCSRPSLPGGIASGDGILGPLRGRLCELRVGLRRADRSGEPGGSLFYGGMLGVFVLAFFVKRVGSNGAFWGVIAGEAAIFAAAKFTSIAFLWYNVIGCVVVIATGLAFSWLVKEQEKLITG